MGYCYEEFEYWVNEIMAIKYDINSTEAYDWIMEETNNEDLAMDVISEIYK